LLFYKTRSQLALLLAGVGAFTNSSGKNREKKKIAIFGDQMNLLFGWSTHSVSD
jgi:hypothetical protein